MTYQHQTRETTEQIRERIARAEAEKQASIDATLANFDRDVALRRAKEEAERKAEREKRDAAQQAEAEAKFERDHMQPIRRAFLANGGSLEEFEREKPRLRNEKLAELSLREGKVQDQWRRQAARRYR